MKGLNRLSFFRFQIQSVWENACACSWERQRPCSWIERVRRILTTSLSRHVQFQCKKMHGRACKQSIFRSYNICSQYCVYLWKSFHITARKIRQKQLRVSNFAVLLLVFKWYHGSEGGNEPKMVWCVALDTGRTPNFQRGECLVQNETKALSSAFFLHQRLSIGKSEALKKFCLVPFFDVHLHLMRYNMAAVSKCSNLFLFYLEIKWKSNRIVKNLKQIDC